MRKQLAIVVFLLITVYACKHEVLNPGNIIPPATDTTPVANPGGPGTTPTGVCFENDILPIFKSSCAKSGCHDAASRNEGYVLDSYDNILKKGIKPGNANDSKIYEVITEDNPDHRMPQPPNPKLTQTQIDLIKKWINEGAKNTTNCGSSCDTTAFKYAADIKPIIDANCVGCHNGATAGAGLNYTSYDGLKAATLNGRLMGAITHSPGFSPMPKGGAKLSDCKIIQIRKWIQAGTPNN